MIPHVTSTTWGGAPHVATSAAKSASFVNTVERICVSFDVLVTRDTVCSVRKSESTTVATIVETIPMLAEGEWPGDEELDFLHRYLDYCGIDRPHSKAFALLYFLFHVGPQLRFADSEEGPKRRMQQVLRRLLQRA